MNDERSRPLVLIVDDDAGARHTLEALLFPEGYELAFAADGAEALAFLESRLPDVLLLDVMMPGMDGLEVCRRIKGREEWRHIPIILVTALDTREDLVRGLDAGADEFISKPVNGYELRARVRAMLRIKQQFDALTRVMRLREDLSHMIVHDIRNPLTIVLMNVFAARRSEAARPIMERLDAIEHEARRLDSFLNDLLMVAKMEEGRLILNPAPANVNEMLEAVREAYTPVAQSRNIRLVTEIPPGSVRLVPLDVSIFRRVLDNLLSNALKFSPPNSTVTIRLTYPSPPPPMVRIQVMDEGPGVREEDRERIFNKFEIVQLKKRDVPEVGLGLAFCRLAVKAHGGRIFVEDNQPCGAVFTVEI
ncbi:MAG: response regulator [Anaerolineae bacterium]|nr:response regulator [Anaerolineae bacterium]